MFGMYGIAAPASLASLLPHWPVSSAPADAAIALGVVVPLLSLAWLAPNTQQLTGYVGPEGTYGFGIAEPAPGAKRWNGLAIWAVLIGMLLALCRRSMARVSEFIYFQF